MLMQVVFRLDNPVQETIPLSLSFLFSIYLSFIEMIKFCNKNCILCRYNIVIFGGIDGFSRKVTIISWKTCRKLQFTEKWNSVIICTPSYHCQTCIIFFLLQKKIFWSLINNSGPRLLLLYRRKINASEWLLVTNILQNIFLCRKRHTVIQVWNYIFGWTITLTKHSKLD